MTRVIHYEDLVLSIEPEKESSYRVRVLNSPYGLSEAPFGPLVDRQELELMIQEVGISISQYHGAGFPLPARHLIARSQSKRPAPDFYEIGTRLFRALFQESVLENYRRCETRIAALPDRGLRIRLIFPAKTAESALLQALPWELLYCDQKRDFLARNVLTPIIRQLAVPGASSPLSTASVGTVRVLIAVASPTKLPALDEADERARILEAFRQQQKVDVDVLEATTLRDFFETLRSKHYQVVHFIAHGDFNTLNGEGELMLESLEGTIHAVPSSRMATAIQASRELRLIFLNSCETAKISYRPGQDPFMGMAAALVRLGVPAVLAMQFPISDSAARIFSEGVYRSLSRGNSLEAAVGDGRFALYGKVKDSWEWATPVLLTSSTSSEVFEPLCFMQDERQGEGGIVRIVGLLKGGSYESARQVIEASLEKSSAQADLHYYFALALLGNRQPRHLTVGEFRQVEARARQVLGLEDCAAHHLCFLATLYKEFFIGNHLRPPKLGYEWFLSQSEKSCWYPKKITELEAFVPSSSNVIKIASSLRGENHDISGNTLA